MLLHGLRSFVWQLRQLLQRSRHRERRHSSPIRLFRLRGRLFRLLDKR